MATLPAIPGTGTQGPEFLQVSMRNPPTENCRDHAKTMPVQAPASSPSSASAARGADAISERTPSRRSATRGPQPG